MRGVVAVLYTVYTIQSRYTFAYLGMHPTTDPLVDLRGAKEKRSQRYSVGVAIYLSIVSTKQPRTTVKKRKRENLTDTFSREY